MKLSEKIKEAEEFESNNDDYWTTEFKRWVKYAEWLEERLEAEGEWTDKEAMK